MKKEQQHLFDNKNEIMPQREANLFLLNCLLCSSILGTDQPLKVLSLTMHRFWSHIPKPKRKILVSQCLGCQFYCKNRGGLTLHAQFCSRCARYLLAIDGREWLGAMLVE